MGENDNIPVIDEFQPESDVFSVWVSEKKRKGTKDGKDVIVKYWEGCWDIPQVALSPDDTRKRPQITASSTFSSEDAAEKCRQKVLDFWMSRGKTIPSETAELTREQRRAAYTVQSFLEEWVDSRTNPNTEPKNRWAENTERKNRGMLKQWIYPYLGDVLLTELTHQQVRLHFTEVLPSVLDKDDQRRLGDRRIRGIYSVFKTGLLRAGGKGLLEKGEFLHVGIQMTFEPAGVPEDIDNLMWDMNALLKRPEVINDPLALRWALAYGEGLRRGERCGLKWSDIDFDENKLNVKRQLNYVPGKGDFLDERLKANEARRIEITQITRPFLEAARKRREENIQSGKWDPKEQFADLVLLREDGGIEKLNHDNELFKEFMDKYQIHFNNLSPGALRHACATFFANYGGPDGRGVTRENLRKFMGHSPSSKLDAYYARASQDAMSREFGDIPIDRPSATRVKS